MNYVKVVSYAKINLTLDITGVEGGYHMIDSVVASIDLCDVITAKRRKDNLISIEMHGEGSESIPYEQNNAARAAERFVEVFKTGGADIKIHKNIPIGAGLGGSSADIAGVLNALSKLYGGVDFIKLKEIADSLGSDCGYMLTGGFARICGRGELVTPLDCDARLYIGILIPESRVSTAECYKLSDSLPAAQRTSGAACEALLKGDVAALGKSLSNGLYCAAAELNGDIKKAYGELSAFDPLGVNMTGSGSAVYAVFENDQFLSYAHSRRSGKYPFLMTKTVKLKGEKHGGRKID